MAPKCPHCQRPLQSRVAKTCSFCGKSLVEGEADWATASAQRTNQELRGHQEAAKVSINPLTAHVAEIVARNGALEEVDELYGDKDLAAEAYGEAMIKHHTPEKAMATAHCSCEARAPAIFVVTYQWKTSEQVRRKFDLLTALALPFGMVTWKEQKTSVGFETFHARCERCGSQVLRERQRAARMIIAAFIMGLGAIFVFGHTQFADRPLKYEYYLAGGLLLGFIVFLLLGSIAKFSSGAGIPASLRCSIAGVDVADKE
jgi:hypothetical protein